MLRLRAGEEVVDAEHLVAARDQAVAEVRSQEPCAARHQDLSVHACSLVPARALAADHPVCGFQHATLCPLPALVSSRRGTSRSHVPAMARGQRG